MGVTTSNKELSTDIIKCGDSFKIRLSLAAEPDIVSNPTDIVLVLDRSGSMAGSPLSNLKSGAKRFIQIIDESTDSQHDGHIGNGSHIGIVSFASTATQDTQLITSVAELNEAVNALSSDRFTNHADAFRKAIELFDNSTANQKVIVMFTDGVTTAGGDPDPIAEAAKAQGIIIYCIGLSGNGGIDEEALNAWASDPVEVTLRSHYRYRATNLQCTPNYKRNGSGGSPPDSAYVAITPDDEEIDELFEDLARNISKPGATDIVITDTVSMCFRITGMSLPTKGTASILNPSTIRWRIDELGVSKSEGAVLEFNVEHLGTCSGTIEVNESTEYDDAEGNVVDFPSPEITINCGTDVFPESCPEPKEIKVNGCTDSIEFDAGELEMESLGRILQLSVTLRNVCPHKRVALAAIITETADDGTEYKRGMKTMTIPAHTGTSCRDVTVRCIKFVLPEDTNVSASGQGMCRKHCFKARFIAHYIDNDFDCCSVII